MRKIAAAGFDILEQREELLTERYADVATIVSYLKAVPWEVPDFSVDRYFGKLLAMHALIAAEGHLDVGFHQLFVVARKPDG